jgi:hypothetical protein
VLSAGSVFRREAWNGVEGQVVETAARDDHADGGKRFDLARGTERARLSGLDLRIPPQRMAFAAKEPVSFNERDVNSYSTHPGRATVVSSPSMWSR